MTEDGHIKVICRFRPLNAKEISHSSQQFIKILEYERTVLSRNTYDSTTPLNFTFDRALKPETSQASVYDIAGKPIVESVLKGFNGTVLAYGQTSSGKTHTMLGEESPEEGIIPRMVRTIFTDILESPDDVEFTVKVAYCEIYLEQVRDLFDPRKQNLRVLEDKTKGIYIQNITEDYVSTEGELYALLSVGTVSYTHLTLPTNREV